MEKMREKIRNGPKQSLGVADCCLQAETATLRIAYKVLGMTFDRI